MSIVKESNITAGLESSDAAKTIKYDEFGSSGTKLDTSNLSVLSSKSESISPSQHAVSSDSQEETAYSSFRKLNENKEEDISSYLVNGDDKGIDGDIMDIPEELIDSVTFDQLLEMDEDNVEREFSRGIVYNYFEQVDTTFASMEKNIKEENLAELSSLGHFLKGSSAALGLTQVKASCELIQNYGARKDIDGSIIQNDKVALQKIQQMLEATKQNYARAKKYLLSIYGEKNDE